MEFCAASMKFRIRARIYNFTVVHRPVDYIQLHKKIIAVVTIRLVRSLPLANYSIFLFQLVNMSGESMEYAVKPVVEASRHVIQ